ncbi:hypothetical protein CAMSH0001_0823 [Campylobacter showae RM3277]|uniref:Uncharacterized protein n=1 Tax=Campylobacter showae RM3277 TaxID=553219 RepID=C6RHJ6_9BACT|nr:hypothetical protein CAMSH0001_0823 [Campylobacter showae RM3277]
MKFNFCNAADKDYVKICTFLKGLCGIYFGPNLIYLPHRTK